MILASDRIHPSGRSTATSDLEYHIDIGIEAVFKPAKSARQQDAEQVSVEHLLENVVGNSTVGFSPFLQLAKLGNHCLSAGNKFFLGDVSIKFGETGTVHHLPAIPVTPNVSIQGRL